LKFFHNFHIVKIGRHRINNNVVFIALTKAIKYSITSWTTLLADHWAPFSTHGERPRPLSGLKRSSNKIRILETKFEFKKKQFNIPKIALNRTVTYPQQLIVAVLK